MGGVGRYSERLARGLAELVDLTIVTLADPVKLPTVTYVCLPIASSRLKRYYATPLRARRIVTDTRPDVVHAHGDDWALSHRTPILRSFYGSSWGEAMSSTGLRRLNHMLLAATEIVSARRADLRVGIAPESQERFRCHALTPPFVPAQAVPSPSPHPAPTAVFIGSFRGRKQGWIAQAAVERLRLSTHPESRLVVIGPSEDAGEWAPWVEHCSGLTDAEVLGRLSEAWLLLSPSAYEGFGIPVVEGLQSYLPVVAMDNPGSRYVRSQGTSDLPLWLEPNQPTFVERVEGVVSQGPYLNPAQTAAATSLVEQFAALGSPEMILRLYRSLLEASHND
ncbi:glycosyltransferase family 4 protein [Nocardioides sp. cx-173]|uniref:glycosyltransferase family 4 protein n=1 Tax=Nocardioides sp. cx-173 TaxID=2898796 RepID=UPI001E319BB4|nr:glycosyltransferase family 4 protein [Nocardioides sp. cx-173]MCD4526946.1 glycosyltransferase family 4 protein [Nocardioides sp. cx-173]UGB41266.1 glycosyltransferase family 4 protein [Nocardioides sp. cx-173]